MKTVNRRQALVALPCLPSLVSAVGLSPAPAQAALDGAALQAAAAAADLHSVMVWHRGALAWEHHRRSRDKPINDWFASDVTFGPDVLHDMRSISKSVVGLLVGQAVARGEVDLQQPVLDHFPELAALKPGPLGAITVEQVLCMTTGLAWDEGVTTYGTSANDETRLYHDAAPLRYILDRPLQHTPGTVWNYNGGCTVVLTEVLQRRSGRRLLDLARADLFEPLGITHWQWRTGAHGQPLAYAGLRLSAADLLRLGRLMLDGGPVVPAAWLQATMVPRATVGNGPVQYGYHWWCGRVSAGVASGVSAGGHDVAWTAGFGNGGQRLFVVPELALAVVFTAGQYNSPTIGSTQFRLFRQIVASMV